KHYRPDLRMEDIRGNVETRIRKAHDPDSVYTATLLACAGLERLGLDDVISQVMPFEIMLPAPGQGALAVQCRDDAESLQLLQPIHNESTAAPVRAERAFLAALEGGCSLPVAAHAEVREGRLYFHGRVTSVDGTQQIDVRADGSLEDASQIGREMAVEALNQGADQILQGLADHG
ncbi:MAG: hydroxymethylbilane synthase, partial [Caldilineaceae bacterium]|nr:hydroxymethylbilane synthase [Caldilineaceae bacterium]